MPRGGRREALSSAVDKSHDSGLRGPAGLHRRRPGIHCHPGRPGDHRRGRPGGVGLLEIRLHHRRCTRDRTPEPVATGKAERQTRAVRARARCVPGPRVRPVQHVADRDRQRRHRHRHPDGERNRYGRTESLPQTPGRPTGEGADHHPFARGPLRRQRCHRPGRRAGCAGVRPGGFPRPCRLGERLRRCGHVPPGGVHLRGRPACRTGRTDRCRARTGNLGRHRFPGAAHR